MLYIYFINLIMISIINYYFILYNHTSDFKKKLINKSLKWKW